MSVRTKAVLLVGVACGLILGWAALTRALAPHGNTQIQHFDVIIVLGVPADSDGNPTPEQLARVTEAVHEYDRGVASHLILTGGPAHNRFAEAEVMARVAESEGIPASAISIEPRARDTIHNACYSAAIMRNHGWRSAEVISSEEHLSRAGLIFSRLPMEWRAHAFPRLEPADSFPARERTFLEILKTARYLVYAQWAESCAS